MVRNLPQLLLVLVLLHDGQSSRAKTRSVRVRRSTQATAHAANLARVVCRKPDVLRGGLGMLNARGVERASHGDGRMERHRSRGELGEYDGLEHVSVTLILRVISLAVVIGIGVEAVRVLVDVDVDELVHNVRPCGSWYFPPVSWPRDGQEPTLLVLQKSCLFKVQGDLVDVRVGAVFVLRDVVVPGQAVRRQLGSRACHKQARSPHTVRRDEVIGARKFLLFRATDGRGWWI